MPWILDGNNLAGGSGRGAVRRTALAIARRERVRMLVFFDGRPPEGTADVERLGSVEVRYVVDADAAILARLGQAGGGWVVATDDRALAARARARGARGVAAADFWAKAEGVDHAEATARPAAGIGAEMERFVDAAQRLPDAPARVVRRRPRPRR